MRGPRTLTIVTAWVLVSLSATLAGAAHQVFRSRSRIVFVHATVQQQDGQLVTGLPREAFTVRDNGVPQEISTFGSEMVPITAVVMIDTSNSVLQDISALRRGAGVFFRALLPGDRATLGTFGDEVAVSPEFTNDADRLGKRLEQELWMGGATPLWEGIGAAMDALEGEAGKRVIVLLTDGFNSIRAYRGSRDTTPSELQARIRRDGYLLYVVRPPFQDQFFRASMDYSNRLFDIVRESGGGRLDLRAGHDVKAAFAQIVRELHHQYVIGFEPAILDGKVHRIDVRVSDPRMKVRARASYVAMPD